MSKRTRTNFQLWGKWQFGYKNEKKKIKGEKNKISNNNKSADIFKEFCCHLVLSNIHQRQLVGKIVLNFQKVETEQKKYFLIYSRFMWIWYAYYMNMIWYLREYHMISTLTGIYYYSLSSIHAIRVAWKHVWDRILLLSFQEMCYP